MNVSKISLDKLERDTRKFWSHVDKSKDCWVWTNIPNSSGYGLMSFMGRSWLAHRISWFLEFAEIPITQVLHKCDNRVCVRPDHLFLGTQLDNMLDKVSKNRHAKHYSQGGSNPNSRLSLGDVQEIRNSNLSTLELSLEFGVTRTQICNIRRGVSWKERG